MQQLAFQYLRDECGLVAYACFPKVGVQKIDSLDTIVQATEASDSSGIFNLLENSDAFLRIDNSRWFLKPDDIHEFTDFEKQHVLFRYNNWNGQWGNQVVWALAPVFEKVVEVYNDEEQCKRRCGYNAGCEFTLNTALKIYSQHQYGTLAEALKACKEKPNITGFDCVNGRCTPSTNTKVLFPISRYGTAEAALEHCQRYCEGSAGYTCTGKGECIYVKENATFPFQTYGEKAQEICHEQTECQKVTDPYTFDKIQTVLAMNVEMFTKAQECTKVLFFHGLNNVILTSTG